jgi:hypothetical protein
LKTLAKWSVRLLVLGFLALVGVVLYLDIEGFPPALKHLVERQFRRAGYAVQFGAIHLDVLRGVFATDAVVADASAPEQTLARIDEVQLQWNYRRMVRREMPIKALRIANATISVPTPADEIGAEHFTAREAYATFRFLDDRTTEIDQLTGVYCGIRVCVSGRVKPRPAGATGAAPKAESEKSQFAFITKSLRELNSLNIEQPPQLDVDFSLDLAQPLQSRVQARLVGVDFGYRKLHVQKAAVAVKMSDGAIDITECRLQIGGGKLDIHGRYDITMGQFDLQLSSTLDPKLVGEALSDDLRRVLQDVRVEENPVIEARYVLSPETGSLPQLKGTVTTKGLVVRDVAFRSIHFAFENQGPEVKIADAKIVTAEGQLTGRGQIHIESSDFAYELDSTLNPRKLLPLMTPVMKQIVEPSWFETPPHIVATVSGDFVDPDAFAYDAELTTGRCSYRGVGLTGATAKLQLRHSRLNVPSLTLMRPEGELRGALLANFNNHQITFDIQTTANPTEMAPLLGPKAGELMSAYRFGPRTEASTKGVVDLDAPGNSGWTAQVANDGFSYWKLSADHATANLTVTNNTLSIENFDADIYAGKLTGRAAFALTNAPTYQFDFDTDNVDIRKLLTAIRGKQSQSSGLMTGHCALQGQGSDLAMLRGQGDLAITDGVLWEMPLFGVFSSIMDGLSPGMGKTKATKAAATFTIADKQAKTDDLQVAAGVFTMDSRGLVGFDGKLDFRIQAIFLKSWPGIGWLSRLLGVALEYKIGGTLSAPTYRATNLPKEFLPHGAIGDKPPDN